jgi:hypothetical protein
LKFVLCGRENESILAFIFTRLHDRNRLDRKRGSNRLSSTRNTPGDLEIHLAHVADIALYAEFLSEQRVGGIAIKKALPPEGIEEEVSSPSRADTRDMSAMTGLIAQRLAASGPQATRLTAAFQARWL